MNLVVWSLFHARWASSKSRDVFDRRPGRIDEALVPEVMHVLDEQLHLALRLPSSSCGPSALPADAVARQGFAKDRHEWPVAGEEDAVKVAVFVDVLGRDVQADERLAGYGDAGDEADALARVLPGGADHVGEGRGGLTEVDCALASLREISVTEWPP